MGPDFLKPKAPLGEKVQCLSFTKDYFYKNNITPEKSRILEVFTKFEDIPIESWRKNIDYRSSVSAKKSLGGGVLLELSHEIDLVNGLFGFCEVCGSNLSISETFKGFTRKKSYTDWRTEGY